MLGAALDAGRVLASLEPETRDALAGAAVDEAADDVDYAGDVVFVRDDPSEDRWDGGEWLTSQRWFDVIWEGHENDTADLPGPAAWGTEDSFLQDPTGGSAQLARELIEALLEALPWWVPWAVGAALAAVLAAAFSYTFGQLFDVQLG